MWNVVDSDKHQVILPSVMRRSVSNMHARLLNGREDLMDLLQGSNTPPPENLWTSSPSSPKRRTTSLSSHSCTTRFESSDLDESVHACLEICVEISQEKERRQRKRQRYCVVLSSDDKDDEDEIASTESVRFDNGSKMKSFSVILRVPLSYIFKTKNKKSLLFKLCCFDTNSVAHVTKRVKSTIGTCTLMWSELIESVHCRKHFVDDDEEENSIGYKLCVSMLCIAALPCDAKKMISPLSASSLLSNTEKEDRLVELWNKRVVRMFRFSTEKSSSLLVTECLSEVPYALNVSRVLLENLISDLKTSLRICRRELAISSCIDNDDDDDDETTKIPVSESSMQQLLVDLHNEAIGETEVERRKEWISIRSQQLSITTSCLEACRKLSERHVTFKSSKEKKNSMLRFFPTNLHVQRLCVHELCGSGGKKKNNEENIGARLLTTADRTARLNVLRNTTTTTEKYHVFRSLQDIIMTAENCYETITLGAGSDHAAKFKNGGIRQMYVMFSKNVIYDSRIHTSLIYSKVTHTRLNTGTQREKRKNES